MIKKLYLLLIPFLVCSAILNADEDASAVPEQKDVPASESVKPAEETASVPAPEKSAELSEAEIVEMVGYWTAQGGGVPMMQLDDSGLTALVTGLVEGLTGKKKLNDFSEESVMEAINELNKRLKAIDELNKKLKATDEENEEDGEDEENEEIPEVSEDTLQKIGYVIFMRSGLMQLEFAGEEVDLIKKGFIAAANKTSPSSEPQAKLPIVQEYIKKRFEAIQAKAALKAEKMAAKRIAAGNAFFEELAEDADVQKSESGLHYKVLEPGADEKPTMKDSVLVHYKGTLIDGTKFDSSYDRGKPAEFPLDGVVKGFGEGLTKIGAGGKIILYIPSELGYGNSPRPGGPIKPGDTLIFECELIEVNPE